MSSSLKLINICKKYKNHIVLDNINIEIAKNQLVGLVGSNGAGKTTLMKTILKLTKMDSGEIYINNINISNQLAFENVGCIIENPKLYSYMTGYENIYAYSLLYNHTYKDNIIPLFEELGLKDSMNKKVKNYSLGMKQKLSIIQSLLNNPSLLILDEPMNGLDPESSYELKNYLKKLSAKITILVSSHILSDLEYMCDQVFMVENGKILNLDISQYKEKDTIIFKTDNSKKSIKILGTDSKNKVDYVDNETITANVSKEDIPSFVEKLIANNIKIYSVYNKKNTLEYIYSSAKKGDYV